MSARRRVLAYLWANWAKWASWFVIFQWEKDKSSFGKRWSLLIQIKWKAWSFPESSALKDAGLERMHHWPWPSWSHFGGRAHRALLPLFLQLLLLNLMVDIPSNHFFTVKKSLSHGSLSTYTQTCLLSCRAYTLSTSLTGKIHSSLQERHWKIAVHPGWMATTCWGVPEPRLQTC